MNYNGKFWTFMGKLMDMVMVSAFYVLCCLPVVTIVPASMSLYYACAKCIRRGEGYLYREFFSSFKGNLKQGIPISLLYLVIGFFLFEIKQFYNWQGISKNSLGGVYFVFYMVAVVILFMITFYLVPVLSRFTIRLGSALRLSVYLGTHNLPTMIPLTITFAGAVALVVTSPLTLIFVPGVYSYAMTKSVEKALKKYILTLPDAKEHEGMWYMEDIEGWI